MTTKLAGILILIAAMAVESFAQMSLKVGSAGGPGILSEPYRTHFGGRGAGRSAAAWVVLGIVAYVLEIFLYTLALQRLDVSVAFPLGSLCFVGVALLSKIFLGEDVGGTRWLGVCCILAGCAFMTL